MRTIKKMFEKPKIRTETLLSNEYVAFENQREYAIEANVLSIFYSFDLLQGGPQR